MTIRLRFAAASALAVLACASPARGQGLTPVERRIVAYADAHTEEAIGLLERTVNVNSGTLNPEGVREVGRIFAAQLESLGFTTRWIDLPDSLHRAGHLFAERRGSRGKRVLIIGHLDTVFERDSPFQRWQRSGSIASGPGANDMKGGDVVIAYALRALEAAGALRDRRIVVAMTGDEENPGRPLSISRADLIEAGKNADVALEFEGASRDSTGRETVVTSRRSSGTWTLRVAARTGHSSGVFGEGVGSGAIYEAARILEAFRTQLREPGLTYNAALALGGAEVRFDSLETRGAVSAKSNIIPASTVVVGDIRTLTDDQLHRTQERMRAIVAASLPEARARITFDEGYPSMPPTPGNLAVLAALNEVNRALGVREAEPNDPARRGAGDISFVAPYVSGIGGLGADGNGSHSDRETIDLSTLSRQIQRAALLIYRLTR